MSTSILRSSSDFHHFLLRNLVHHARKLRWFGINNPEAILDQVRGWPQATSFLDKHGSNSDQNKAWIISLKSRCKNFHESRMLMELYLLGKRERVLVVRQVVLKEPLNPLHRNLCISNLPYFILLSEQGTNFRVQTKHACSIFYDTSFTAFYDTSFTGILLYIVQRSSH